MSTFKDQLETYIDGAKQHVARQGAGPVPAQKSEKARETFIWRRQNSIEHAKRIAFEGECLLAAVEAKRDVWIIVQLALELGKLHERWKVDELKRRSANHRKGAEQRNGQLTPTYLSQGKIKRRITDLRKEGHPERKIPKIIEEEGLASARHVRRLREQM